MAQDASNPLFGGDKLQLITYKEYEIDLDKPARERWKHVVRDNMEHMGELVKAYNEAVVAEFGALAPLAGLLAGMVSVPEVFKEEMRGMAEASNGRAPYDVLVRLNVGYDFVAKCTSGGVRVNGTLYHVRNMDWDLPVLRTLAILVRFTRGGKTVHQGITWLGFVGTYTQMSSQGYSISLNFRKVGTNLLFHITGALVKRQQSLGFVVRLLLEEQLPLDQFVRGLEEAPLIAPCYLTVVGTDKAMVLTLGKIVDQARRTLEDVGNGSACVIQTNHDPWRCQSSHRYAIGDDKAWIKWADGDDLLVSTRERYTCAMEGIKKVAAELGAARGADEAAAAPPAGEPDEAVIRRLTHVMQTPPVKNAETVYGVIMVPAAQRIYPIN